MMDSKEGLDPAEDEKDALYYAMRKAREAFNDALDEHVWDPAYFDLKMTGYILRETAAHHFTPSIKLPMPPKFQQQLLQEQYKDKLEGGDGS